MRMPEEREETKLQMSAMIDMVFLLIIFFMTASHMNAVRNEELDMPVASHANVPKERMERWTVNVAADGAVSSGQTPVALDELRVMVAGRVAEDPGTKVYLRADRQTPHRAVRQVMNAMAESGVGDFIFGVISTGDDAGGEP
ncbi:MAG: biopolymer transporter ExbD [Kiritimatiellae bacterium]|nr:biopolymer transporter ExbD [Kiritimatiellia bacterium]